MSQQSQPKRSYGYQAAHTYAQRVVIIAALGLALLLLMLLWSPCIITSNVNATDATDTQTVTVPEPTLSVSLSSAVELNIVPANTGTTSSTSTSLSITTTDSDSYSVYLSAEGNGALASADPDNTATIANTSTAATLAGLKANTWGYTLSTDTPTSSTLYQALPTDSDTAILTVDTAATDGANDTYNLSFGTKVDGNLPADTYTTEVTVSVVAAPRAPTLSDITYMQDMTPEICAASQENETKRLIDSRDGKYYWVAKLADGNCWMTQNLELSFDEVTTLTPEDSDVSSDWTPGVSMLTSATAGYNSATVVQAWDLGNYVKNNPLDFVGCVSTSQSRVTDLSKCQYFTEADSMTAMTEYRTDSVSVEGSSYDAHYLAGYYYSWNAATAGTGVQVVGTDNATSSICPAGWRLSLSSPDNNAVPGSFYYLLQRYGLSPQTTAGEYHVAGAPLFFVASGYISIGSRIVYAGADAVYRSSTAIADNNNAYAFTIQNGGTLYTSGNGYYKAGGGSVRCLANL